MNEEKTLVNTFTEIVSVIVICSLSSFAWKIRLRKIVKDVTDMGSFI